MVGRAEFVPARGSLCWPGSGGSAVFVDQPAEDLAAPDRVDRNRLGHRDVGAARWSLAKTSMGAVLKGSAGEKAL